MHYLAYGSNMLTARLAKRVPSARNPRVAALPGHVVRYRRLSVDGSTKCDLVRAEESATAYGVIYDIDPDQRPNLDAAESVGNGYHREQLTVAVDDRELTVFTYIADASHIAEQVAPYGWYRDLVVGGALEHGLPGRYIDEQLDVTATSDPDAARDRRERAVLP